MSKSSRKAETRHDLLEAFWSLYIEKPIEKITIREITDLAGYSRGTFYTYFSDVYEVLEVQKAALMPTVEQIIDPLKEIQENNGKIVDPAKRVSEYIRTHGDRIAIMLGPGGDPSFGHELKARVRKVMMHFALELGIRELKEYEYVIEYHILGMINMYQLWVENDRNISEETLSELYERVSHGGTMNIMSSMMNDRKTGS
ncbi:TetR/AcrR family transcriptional regulator [Salinicoccus sp. ID82-1]|uniref:TetR/AcrR family transcriptional regulator n=1 Tax=Salinicoccus sp. ID82-1 TaxID=2820269 RepID=UPI001F424DEF|nr:TetR/AcrR family transcriptional regulator [Salinicoccus sp. ID82-1]MCG1010076.1 TetR/AcrR family transcriptional regulator [Salinicoccus sp. ID82-1]